jgi:hypothetical protein
MAKYGKRSTRRARGGYLGRGGAAGMPPAPNPSTYSSGAEYGRVVSGSGSSQYNRVFMDGPTGGMGQSNALNGMQGQQSVTNPNTYSLKGGRRRGAGRRKKGGLFGPVLNQAIVPFGILAMQQSYGRKGHSDTKKYYKRNSRRRSFRKF